MSGYVSVQGAGLPHGQLQGLVQDVCHLPFLFLPEAATCGVRGRVWMVLVGCLSGTTAPVGGGSTVPLAPGLRCPGSAGRGLCEAPAPPSPPQDSCSLCLHCPTGLQLLERAGPGDTAEHLRTETGRGLAGWLFRESGLTLKLKTKVTC